MGDGGRGVPKSTHDATETDHADQNETHDWTEHKQIDYEKNWILKHRQLLVLSK